MKKAFVVGLLFLNMVCYAQKSKIELGFQGGINLNTAYGNGISKDAKSSTTGLSIGGNAKWNFSEQLGLRAQLSYEQFGFAYSSLYFLDSTGNIAKGDVLFNLNYLNLPLFVEYKFGKKVKFLVEAGGFIGVMLNNRIVEKRAFPYPGQPAEISYSSNYRSKVNAGLAAGIGTQIPLTSKISLDINVRNYTGLANTNKKISAYNSSIKTMSFSFLSGLSFQL